MAASLAGIDRVIVAGSGSDHVSARELALKLAEGARLPSDAHDLETVLHGHLAAATRWTGLVVVMTDAGTGTLVRERAIRVLEAAKALGVPAAAIIADSITADVPDELVPAGRIVLPHTGRVGGVAGSLLASAMALQVLTERLARARSVNPGHARPGGPGPGRRARLAAKQREQADVEAQVVEGGEPLGRQVADLEQVMQVGGGVARAERAVAALLDRPVVDAVVRVMDAHGAVEGVAR